MTEETVSNSFIHVMGVIYVMSVRRMVSKASTRWREEGPRTVLSAASERVADRLHRYRVRRTYEYTGARSVIEVDPERITEFLIEGDHPAISYREKNGFATKHELDKAHFPIDRFEGAVVPGDWDQYGKPHWLDRVYVGARERFEAGTKWEETEYGQHMLVLDELYGHDFFARRTERCEALYRSMAADGYRPSEIATRNVAVNVGRDGEMLFNNEDGHHRLALAKILGIDRIPVIVVVRHERWQALREAVAAADTVDDLDERAQRHLDHPDVRTLHDFDDSEPWSNPLAEGLRLPARLLFGR